MVVVLEWPNERGFWVWQSACLFLRLVRHLGDWQWPRLLLPVLLSGVFASFSPSTGEATDRQTSVFTTKSVLRLLEDVHVSGRVLDGELVCRTLENYMSLLDPNRLYFEESDLDQLRLRQRALLASVSQGDVGAASEIHRLYLDRLKERGRLLKRLLRAPVHVTPDVLARFSKRPVSFPSNSSRVDAAWREWTEFNAALVRATGVRPAEERKLIMQHHERMVERAGSWTDDQILAYFLEALASAHDPDSHYYGRNAMAGYCGSSLVRLSGVGVSLSAGYGLTQVEVVDATVVASKLRPGDRIMAVGEGEEGELTNVLGWNKNDVRSLLVGASGSQLRVQVLTVGESRPSVHALVRATPSGLVTSFIVSGDTIPMLAQEKIGYVYVPGVGVTAVPSIGEQLRRVLTLFKQSQVDLVVLDLRDTTLSMTTDASCMAPLFMGPGPVFTVRQKSGNAETCQSSSTSESWDGPLTVVTSSFTSGGAQLLAAALKDRRRALIVGDASTFGKAVLSTVVPIDEYVSRGRAPTVEMGALAVTSAIVYRVNGENLYRRGLRPHIVVPCYPRSGPLRDGGWPFPSQPERIVPAVVEKSDYSMEPAALHASMERSTERQRTSSYFTGLATGDYRSRPVGALEPSSLYLREVIAISHEYLGYLTGSRERERVPGKAPG